MKPLCHLRSSADVSWEYINISADISLLIVTINDTFQAKHALSPSMKNKLPATLTRAGHFVISPLLHYIHYLKCDWLSRGKNNFCLRFLIDRAPIAQRHDLVAPGAERATLTALARYDNDCSISTSGTSAFSVILII